MQQQKTNTGGKGYAYLLLETGSEFMGRMWPEQLPDDIFVYLLCVRHNRESSTQGHRGFELANNI